MRPIQGTITEYPSQPYVPDVIPTQEDAIVEVFKLYIKATDAEASKGVLHPATLKAWDRGRVSGLESALFQLTFIPFSDLYEVGERHLERRSTGYPGTIASTWEAIKAERPAPSFAVEVVRQSA